MPRRQLYGEETEPFNIQIPASVKLAIQDAAQKQHLSMTQLVTAIFKDYLKDNNTPSALPGVSTPAHPASGNQQESGESTRRAPALSQR